MKMESLFAYMAEYISLRENEKEIIVSNFSLSARERYLQFRKNYPDIEQQVPQYMVASYLGITKEFLSKIRNQLIKK